MTPIETLVFDLEALPFSRAGSFLTITPRGSSVPGRLIYKTCSSRVKNSPNAPYSSQDFFEINLTQISGGANAQDTGATVGYTWQARPHRLDLSTPDGRQARLAFIDADTIGFELDGVGLRLRPLKSFAAGYWGESGQYVLVDYSGRGFHQFRPGDGARLSVTNLADTPKLWSHDLGYQIDFTPDDRMASGALRFSRYERDWADPLPALEKVIRARQDELEQWMAKCPLTPEAYQPTAELAWYLLWNCQVPAEGALTRPVMYMSKFWMNNIWAWDNCFDALAVAAADPEMAWNQLLVFFDHQEANGMIPDSVNDLEAIYLFNKPPVYGWTIRKLIDIVGLEGSRPHLERLYKPVSRLTEWWYAQRDYDRDGMCQYHHGNDSGWDNATAFDQGYPTEGADLAAHLTLQMEGLAYIAAVLGLPGEARRWKERAEEQLRALLAQGVKGYRFFSPLNGKREAPVSQSLLNLIPMVLGHRLPSEICTALVSDLSPDGLFLTDYGLATEAPQSPKYEPDGYWRGPIWAPSTYLIFDGLRDAGEMALARTIATRFCDLCVKAPGFWENFDALNGTGLRCPGYSWTAAVFLLLAEWLNQYSPSFQN